jgi:hypothetical protein
VTRERPPQGPPKWLAFIAGAALTVLAYGALRSPERPRPAAKAMQALSPASAHRARTPPAEHRTSESASARPTRTEPVAVLMEADAGAPFDEPPDDDQAGADLAGPSAPAPARAPAQPDAGTRLAGPSPALPLGHPPLGHPPLGHPPISDPAASDEPPEDVVRATIRRVEVTVISRWQQPGMCEKPGPASAARRAMMGRFQRVKWEPNAILFLDPRLPYGSQRNLFAPLEAAEREIAEQLDLHPARPDVFAYRDTQLLLAGGCTNDNVVAYYDGDMHVVATHSDVQQSITHEYTHHALMTSGLVAPAWAQEGIAMNVARETWWQTGEWLERVAARPFALDVMERTVPYTMTSEQALAFYVQAAAMVWCSTLDDPEGLRGLVRKLSTSGSTLDYELPPLAEPSSLRACTREILDAGHGE